MIHRVYAVFNAQQIDGIPPMPVKTRDAWEICESGEAIVKNSGAEIRHGGSRAFYSRTSDHIQLPAKTDFVSAPAYYGTATHDPSQHAAYVAPWITALRDNKNEIFRAASALQRQPTMYWGLNKPASRKHPPPTCRP
jgi:antirestriction protein ArdC